MSARTVVIQSTTCQLPAHPGTVREKRLKAGSAARVPRGAKPPKVTPRDTLFVCVLGRGTPRTTKGRYACFICGMCAAHRSLLQLHHKLLFTPKLAVVLLEFLTPQTILRQVIAGRTVLWEASKPPTRRMTMLRVLTRAGPTCLRHTVPTPAGTGAGLQEGKHRSIRPCAGPKVHTGTALPSGSSGSRAGWRWRVKPPNAVTVAGGYAIAVYCRMHFGCFWFGAQCRLRQGRA